MKLRRRRKEEGGPTLRALPQPDQSAARLPLLATPSTIIPLSLHPLPPARTLRRPASLPPRAGEQYSPAIPSPAVLLLPSFFIKITEATERGGRSTQLADPAVLPNDSMRMPSSPRPCPFTQSGGRGSSPVLMASSLWRVEP